jgi:hypothetical protein
MTTVIATAKYRHPPGHQRRAEHRHDHQHRPTRNSGRMNAATQVLIWVSVNASSDMV